MVITISKGPYLMFGTYRRKITGDMVTSGDVRQVFKQDLDFARTIICKLAACYGAAIRITNNLKLRTLKERLANYLLRTQLKNNRSTEFQLKYEKPRLASHLGMTPENLSRAFASLKKLGVNVDGQKVALDNLDALMEFAKPTFLIDG